MKSTANRLLRLLRDAEKRIAELEARNQRLWRLSSTDELTGYLNRRRFWSGCTLRSRAPTRKALQIDFGFTGKARGTPTAC